MHGMYARYVCLFEWYMKLVSTANLDSKKKSSWKICTYSHPAFLGVCVCIKWNTLDKSYIPISERNQGEELSIIDNTGMSQIHKSLLHFDTLMYWWVTFFVHLEHLYNSFLALTGTIRYGNGLIWTRYEIKWQSWDLHCTSKDPAGQPHSISGWVNPAKKKIKKHTNKQYKYIHVEREKVRKS